MIENKIPKDYDHKKESSWQKIWQKNNIHKFIGDGTRPYYIIDTPPPYPTGSIHMGHVLNWLYMDIIARYNRMKGFDVMFPQGWDCHGLPTEVKVEETYKIKKSDVPREKFREMCIDLTRENIKMMRSQMQKLGFSQDWSREYVTMTDEYMEKTQLSFLKLYQKGLIYQGIHPVNWCPRCETAIAFAEVEYSENETYLNYLEFKEENGGKGVMIATTRPELLSACVAVVVHPDDERYQELAGKKVIVPLFGQKVEIITDKEVDPEFGTGAVMICTFGDKTDVSWVNRYNLNIIEAIDEKGMMTTAAGKYEGLPLSVCKVRIIEDLENQGILIKKEKIDQNLGQCWRCKTPIEILVKKQWFVAVKDMINDVTEASEDMNWVPEHMKTRLLNWTGSMDWDWCISRQRIFATPIPVWYCTNCGKVHLPQPDELPIDPAHESFKAECECGNSEFRGEVDVLDTWMDSSISPLVIAGWPSDEYKKLYPSKLRQQGHDIIRTWAFYTILRCKALTGYAPFNEVVVNGMVFGDDGHKMSKSRGNVISPEDVITDYGADALRLWASNSVPGSDVPFEWKDVKYGYKFIRKFWNAFRFINIHISEFEIDESEDNFIKTLKPLDKWILSKLNRLNKLVTNSLDSYQFAEAVSHIQRFVWHDFCDEYIESVKYRLYTEKSDMSSSKNAAQYTLKTVILTSLKLLAPFIPHFVEEVYQHINNSKNFSSIHSTSWQEFIPELIDDESENLGNIGVQIIGEIRRFKSASKMPLNTNIKTVNIYTSDKKLHAKIKKLIDDIKGTMRISKLNVEIGKPDIHEKVVEVTPKMDKIGPEFKKDSSKIVKYLNSTVPQDIVNQMEQEGFIIVEDCKITLDHITLKKEVVGKTGEKVEIQQIEDLGIILEIVI
ncbi:MAG: valine--tRNA ligase [Methanobacteriaceae archaeon]|nr:valine--tRNA ligase [Methanobacteriaceae archaeon]